MADIHDRMPPGCSILLRLIQRGKPHQSPFIPQYQTLNSAGLAAALGRNDMGQAV